MGTIAPDRSAARPRLLPGAKLTFTGILVNHTARLAGMTGGLSDGSECWISSKALGAKLDPICGKIKNEREAMSLVRMFLSARENAQCCAVDCAPYVHAKLQAVHHERGTAVRYIIADRR